MFTLSANILERIGYMIVKKHTMFYNACNALTVCLAINKLKVSLLKSVYYLAINNLKVSISKSVY